MRKWIVMGVGLGRVLAVIMLFFALTVQAGTLNQIGKLLPADGAAGDYFGNSVAVSGNLALIGAWGDDDNGDRSGSAYVFDLTTGEQFRKLLPSDGNVTDQFGGEGSVALSGNIALIAAVCDDDNGDLSGSAYVFDVTTGAQLRKLLPTDGSADDRFGMAVALSGAYGLIGASTVDNNGPHSGGAYVFDITTGEQLHKLLPIDGAAYDYFGGSVALSGNLAVVGAWADDDHGDLSGSAYVFDVTTGQQLRKLLPSDGAGGLYFGSAVALSGNLAVIGSPGGSGSAYVFDVTTGQQLRKLLPPGSSSGGFFGGSIALSGTIAIIGAHEADDNGNDSGSAYLFNIATGELLQKLLPSDGLAEDRFGRSVALDGDIAVVGTYTSDDNGPESGSAYVFAFNTPLLMLPTHSFDISVPLGTSSYVTNFTVQLFGASNMVYQISTNASWLSVSPSSGFSTGEVDTITLNIDLSSLVAGSYTGLIEVVSSEVTNSPQVIQVQLDVISSVIYVSATGSDSSSGFSWNTAKATIQAGVDALTVTNGTVLVSNGVYDITSEIVISKALTLRSVNGPEVTTIDAQWFSQCLNLGNYAVVVGGFSLVNGFADDPQPGGGAVYCDGTTPLLTNCVISGNIALNAGGGVFFGTLRNCVIQDNESFYGVGGGMVGSLAKNCLVQRNSAINGGGMYEGAATNCIFKENVANGGGISYGNGLGGGMSCGLAAGCLFVSNSAWNGYGGGLYQSIANNCTVVGNSADYSGGGMYEGEARNCIIYYNQSDYGDNDLDSTSVLFSCGQDLRDGIYGNINNAPLFIDATGNGNYRLAANSPCIDKGVNAYSKTAADLDGAPRIFNSRVDMGAYEFNSALADSDSDGLNDVQEIQLGTNLNNPDTDGDGFKDGWEVSHGWSPTRNDSSVLAYIENNPSVFGYYTDATVGDLAMGEMMVKVIGTNISVRLQMMKSSDLITWTNTEQSVDWTIPATGKEFFRVRAQP